MSGKPVESGAVIQLVAALADEGQLSVAVAVIFFDSEIFASESC
jgi:hypothetical protein